MLFKRWLVSLRRSLFFKILLIFLMTAIFLSLLVALSASYLSDPQRFIHQKVEANLQTYVNHLIEDIGTPPDYAQANKLAETLGLEIEILANGERWQSKAYSVPANYRKNVHKLIQRENFLVAHYRGYSFVITKNGQNTFSFSINHKRFTENKMLFMISLIFIIIIVLSFCYFLIRWLLKPITWLTAGVAEVSGGNFSTKVPVRKNDELGDLTVAFNNMSNQIDIMMNSKQQLLLDVSHELRSPLTRMKLAMEFVKDANVKVNLQDDVREMEVMITELLESARLSNSSNQLKINKFSLVELLTGLAARYKNSHPDIVLNKINSPIFIEADQERIQILLRNLVDNAIKYSQHQSKPIEVTLIDNDKSIIIYVKDYGEGISKFDQAHIFEPFYRVDKSRNAQTGGYGLGLNLCRKIVEAHDGNITVESEVGIYTQFCIELPKQR